MIVTSDRVELIQAASLWGGGGWLTTPTSPPVYGPDFPQSSLLPPPLFASDHKATTTLFCPLCYHVIRLS